MKSHTTFSRILKDHFQPLFLEWGTVVLLPLDREPSVLIADACVLALSVLIPCDWLGLLAANCRGNPEHSSDALARG